MSTALDVDVESLDEHERNFVAKIREHGWFRTSVSAEAGLPGFSFSTGFWISKRAPELILFGTKDEIVHDVFWDIYRNTLSGVGLPVGRRTDRVFANLSAYAFPVAKRHYPEHLGWSRWFYGNDEFPCHQIVWPDRAGVFPWEPGFDASFAMDQPDLTESGWSAAITD